MADLDKNTEAWRAAAHDTLRTLAETNKVIVSDMLIEALERDGNGLANYSQLGGVFKRAAKAGLIQKTDDRQFSTRSKSHSTKTVWRSLTYKTGEPVNPEQAALAAMINNALEYNAAVVAQASLAFAAGPMPAKHLTKVTQRFAEYHDAYSARYIQITEDLERSIRNGA